MVWILILGIDDLERNTRWRLSMQTVRIWRFDCLTAFDFRSPGGHLGFFGSFGGLGGLGGFGGLGDFVGLGGLVTSVAWGVGGWMVG
jgi:hypothetical protein